MRYRFQTGERVYEVQIERAGGDHPAGAGYRAIIDGQSYEFEVLDSQPGTLSLRLEGRPATIYWAAAPSAAEGGGLWLSADGCTYRLDKPKARSAHAGHSAAASDAGEAIRAPMPAQVRAVQVEEGEQVEKGQTLLLLEAMKMEIRVRAPSAGRVTRLLAAEGQAVEKEQVLVEMEAA